MSNQRISNRALLLSLVLFLLLVPGNTQALPFDMVVWSENFEPDQKVYVNVTGPANMTFNIRIVDSGTGDIIAGRDAQTNETGGHSFIWQATREGKFNATVTFATGVSITRQFVIQEKITKADLSLLYRLLFDLRDDLENAVRDLRGMLNIAIALSAVAILISGGVLIYVKKNVSRADSEFEKWMKSDVKDFLRAQFEKKK